MATGKFTFIFSERELSILQDALDCAVESNLSTEHFDTDDFAALAMEVSERLAW